MASARTDVCTDAGAGRRGRVTAGIAPRNGRHILFVSAVVIAAIAVRVPLLEFHTRDYATVLSWYTYILHHGHFSSLGNGYLTRVARSGNYAAYNEPYLYLLTLMTYTHLEPLIAIKAISIGFDFVLGFFTYRIVSLRYPEGWQPLVAAAIVLFLPTVVTNSALWGQVDASYASLCLGGIYLLLRRRPWAACLFFGLALGFKLQAIFLVPVLLLLALRRYVPWRALLLVPGVVALLDVPALLIGAKLSDLTSIYTTQVGTYSQLSLNAPNVYQFLGYQRAMAGSTLLRSLGIDFTFLLLCVLIALVVLRRLELTGPRVLLACTVCALAVPYFLPAMHERYFYLADALTVIAAFYVPRRLWVLPILEQIASGLSYLPYLLQWTTTGDPMRLNRVLRMPVDFRILASVMLASLILALAVSAREFRISRPFASASVTRGLFLADARAVLEPSLLALNDREALGLTSAPAEYLDSPVCALPSDPRGRSRGTLS